MNRLLLISYIDGKQLDEMSDISDILLKNIGISLAQHNLAMLGFDHPAGDVERDFYLTPRDRTGQSELVWWRGFSVGLISDTQRRTVSALADHTMIRVSAGCTPKGNWYHPVRDEIGTLSLTVTLKSCNILIVRV